VIVSAESVEAAERIWREWVASAYSGTIRDIPKYVDVEDVQDIPRLRQVAVKDWEVEK
jgi:hypothetical protein